MNNTIEHARQNAIRLRDLANKFPIGLQNEEALLCRDAADDIDLLIEEIARLHFRNGDKLAIPS